MTSKQIDVLTYMSCPCGKHPRMIETHSKGETTYHAEALCCHMQTVRLRSPQAAAVEFRRMRATQELDKTAPTHGGESWRNTVLPFAAKPVNGDLPGPWLQKGAQ